MTSSPNQTVHLPSNSETNIHPADLTPVGRAPSTPLAEREEELRELAEEVACYGKEMAALLAEDS